MPLGVATPVYYSSIRNLQWRELENSCLLLFVDIVLWDRCSEYTGSHPVSHTDEVLELSQVKQSRVLCAVRWQGEVVGWSSALSEMKLRRSSHQTTAENDERYESDWYPKRYIV